MNKMEIQQLHLPCTWRCWHYASVCITLCWQVQMKRETVMHPVFLQNIFI